MLSVAVMALLWPVTWVQFFGYKMRGHLRSVVYGMFMVRLVPWNTIKGDLSYHLRHWAHGTRVGHPSLPRLIAWAEHVTRDMPMSEKEQAAWWFGTEAFLVDKRNHRVFKIGWDCFGFHAEQEYPIEPVGMKTLRERIAKSAGEQLRRPLNDATAELWAFCEVARWDVEVRCGAIDYPEAWFNTCPLVGNVSLDPDDLDEDPKAAEMAEYVDEAKDLLA